MEVSGVVLRQIPCVSGSVTDGRYSGLRFSGNTRTTTVGFRTRRFRGIVCNNSEFADNGHMSYYSGTTTTRCGGEGKDKMKVMEKEKKKEMKKKAKVLKALSKNLNMFSSIGFGLDPEAGLVAEIQNKTISEATGILVKQLDQLKAEEKLLKKQRKEEKAKAKALKMDSESSSSSESSDSDCDKGKVVDMSSLRNKAVLEPLQPESSVATLPRIQEDSCKNTGEALKLALLQSAAASTAFPSVVNPGLPLKKVEAVSVVGLPLKRVEVCMGGKCKKSGGAVLLDEFQKAMTGMEGSAVGCKCMGKCRDGPNVRVVNESDAVMTDSVRTPSKTLCVGVGLQDVETIVTSFFDEEL
ncbi:Diacylglycerol O-acyltransferase 3 [Hirschfeldia incana]|nr:Diacylglycerol O-acyltransferase 3 [Hirschfeldia incana]